MSYSRTALPASAAQRSVEARRATALTEHHLSANAQAWRRLAVVGYHRTAEIVRATCPTPTPAEAEASTENNTADSHQSGFQSL